MRTVNHTSKTTSARVAPLRRSTIGAVALTAGRQHPLIALHRAAGNHSVHRLLQRVSFVGKDYSRGNDDQWECCYETSTISVSLNVDDAACVDNKNGKASAWINYSAGLGGKTKEADASDAMQGTQEGPDHYLEEKGVKNAKKATLAVANPKGPDAGNSLSARLDLQNVPTCGGPAKTGCVLVKGPKTTQQEIKWSADGTKAKSIEANQLQQPQEKGMNRLKSAIPLRPRGGYPKVTNAEPRHKDCWCDPLTGYHMNYAGKAKCPSKYRVNSGKDLPPELEATKDRPKEPPKVCVVDKSPSKIC
jgi:hypothetical protein